MNKCTKGTGFPVSFVHFGTKTNTLLNKLFNLKRNYIKVFLTMKKDSLGGDKILFNQHNIHYEKI